MSKDVGDLRALYFHRAPRGPGISGLQPAIQANTNAVSVGAGSVASGLFEVFGGRQISGDAPNRSFTHSEPPAVPWEIWGFTAFIGMDRGAFGEALAHLHLNPYTDQIQGQMLMGWHAVNHGQYAWFLASPGHIAFPVPMLIGPNTKLYLRWLASNQDIVARSFDMQLHLIWRYAEQA